MIIVKTTYIKCVGVLDSALTKAARSFEVNNIYYDYGFISLIHMKSLLEFPFLRIQNFYKNHCMKNIISHLYKVCQETTSLACPGRWYNCLYLNYLLLITKI